MEAGQAHRGRRVGEDRALEVLGRSGPPRRGKTRSSGPLPATCAASSSTRKRGIGTARRSGAPLACPRPRSRGPAYRLGDGGPWRSRSSRRTRSAAISPNRTPVYARNSTVEPVRPAALGELVDLVVGEVHVLGSRTMRGRDAVGGVADQPPVLDGELQHQRDRRRWILCTSTGTSLALEGRDPALGPPWPTSAMRCLAPLGQHVLAQQDAGVRSHGAWA